MAKRSTKSKSQTDSKSKRILVCTSPIIVGPPVVNAEVSFSKEIAPHLYTPEKPVSDRNAERLCSFLRTGVRWVTDSELQILRTRKLQRHPKGVRIPKYVMGEIVRAEKEARAALKQVGRKLKDLRDFHAMVIQNGYPDTADAPLSVAFVGGSALTTIGYGGVKLDSEGKPVEQSYVDPLAKPDADGIGQILVTAMLVACCRCLRERQYLGFTQSRTFLLQTLIPQTFILSQMIERLRMALRFPDIRKQVITAFRQENAKKANAKYDEARSFARDTARKSWEEDRTTRIGEMAEYVRDRLREGGMQTPTKDTARKWIKDLAPEEASRPGRPSAAKSKH